MYLVEHANRQVAEEHYREVLIKAKTISDAEAKAVMAELGRRDLYYLMTRILCYEDSGDPKKPRPNFYMRLPPKFKDWLFERCKMVRNAPNGYLDLWAREHFKSSIITFALTIQDIINDPEMTFGIFSFTRPTAKVFLKRIKWELEENIVLKELYPDIFYANPQKDSPKWSEDEGLIVKRKGNPMECTVEAWGFFEGVPAGRHFTVRVYDDLITEKFVTNPDMIRRAIEQWDLSLFLGQAIPNKMYGEADIERYSGTRYHDNDPYREIISRDVTKPRFFPGTHNGKADGKPVMWDEETLERKRKKYGRFSFACQILQDPRIEGVMAFDPGDLMHYSSQDWREMNIYLLCDPANSLKKESDYTVMLVIGLGVDRNYYLIDGIRERIGLTDRAHRFIDFYMKYFPISVGYEKYGKDSDIDHIEYIQNERNRRFVITPLGGRLGQDDRIAKLIPLFESHRFYIPLQIMFIDNEDRQHNLVTEFIEEEYKRWPVCIHRDILDCMSRIIDDPSSKPERRLGAVFPIPIENILGSKSLEIAETEYDYFNT